MSKIEEVVTEIKEQKIGPSEKRALIVEGRDDVDAFTAFLNKKHPTFGSSWVVAEAGKKQNVIEVLRKESNWLGVVDRDEWPEEKCDEIAQEVPNLVFLPRFCIESYLVVPDELWRALPPKQKAKIPDGLDHFTGVLLQDVERWVRHGALWSVINPLWEGLLSLGFKKKLLDPEVATDEDSIRHTLEEWHEFITPEKIIDRFQEKLEQVNQLPMDEQLRRHIHGKKFYETVVDKTLNDLLGQKGANHRQRAILQTLEVPHDLETIWRRMGLNE